MNNFDPVSIEWKGKDYTIKPDRVLGAIARIEDVVTMAELQRFWNRGTAPMAKIAMAFGAVLRYAGANVTDDEVYIGMFEEGGAPAETVVQSITLLIQMMIPKTARAKIEKDDKSGNGSKANDKNTDLLKKPTSSSLAGKKSKQKTSGS